MAKRNNSDRKITYSIFDEFPTVSLTSNREAVIYGTKGVIEYNRNLIKLNCDKIILTITGSELSMKALSLEEVIINGIVFNVDFSGSIGD